MMQYLIILLDNSAASFCHYEATNKRSAISVEILHKGITYAMKQNLMIQFIYPTCELPKEILEEVEKIDHSKIVPIESPYRENADILLYNTWNDFQQDDKRKVNDICLLRISKKSLFENIDEITDEAIKIKRLNIVLTDIQSFTEEDFESYKTALSHCTSLLSKAYIEGKQPQINLITDRIQLEKMNNCNAGTENITLAPNGCFYICPAYFAEDESSSIGNIDTGIQSPNRQLYDLSKAPLCKLCDAFQCKRCIWLNERSTNEVNTPSHEQCVVSHIERNASLNLLRTIREKGSFMPNKDIQEIKYLDPFDVFEQLKYQ